MAPKCNGPPDANRIMSVMFSFSFIRHEMPFAKVFNANPILNHPILRKRFREDLREGAHALCL